MFQSDPLLPSTAFQPLIRALRSVGIWWPEPSTTQPWKAALYSYYSVIVVFLCTHIYTTGQFLFCWTVRDDFDNFVNALFLLMTNLPLMVKMFNWNRRFARIRRLTLAINDTCFMPKTDAEIELVRQATATVHRLFVFFLPGAWTCIFFWMITPMLDAHSARFQLPIPMWFFFEVRSTSVYIIMYVYQWICLMGAAVLNLTVDAYTAGMMSMASAQVQMLGARLAAVGWHHEEHASKSGGGVYRQRIDAERELRACTVFYRQLTAFIREIQGCFAEPLFFQLGCTCVMLCVTGYQMLSLPVISVPMTGMAMYMVVINLQLSCYCWTGNEVMFMSNKLLTQVYFCNFVAFERRSARILLIMMQMLQRPLILSAVGLFEIKLCMTTYMTVVKAAYSNLMVLNSMDKE